MKLIQSILICSALILANQSIYAGDPSAAYRLNMARHTRNVGPSIPTPPIHIITTTQERSGWSIGNAATVTLVGGAILVGGYFVHDWLYKDGKKTRALIDKCTGILLNAITGTNNAVTYLTKIVIDRFNKNQKDLEVVKTTVDTNTQCIEKQGKTLTDMQKDLKAVKTTVDTNTQCIETQGSILIEIQNELKTINTQLPNLKEAIKTADETTRTYITEQIALLESRLDELSASYRNIFALLTQISNQLKTSHQRQ
ncbi:hypothetical protein KG892_01980 [Vermiphilus pyriformis]|nr:MAG: hypothetical protein KG892_01980 [Vermiphilus pyriformis]